MTESLFIKLSLVIFILLTSCAHQTYVNNNIITAKKSFIKIETFLESQDCENRTCEEQILYSSASGAVVMYGNKKHILTAAHVCNANSDLFGPKEVEGYRARFILVDIDDRRYEGKVVKVSFPIDSCLLYSEELELPHLRLSTKKPEYSEKVYNMAAPLGIFHKNMVPLMTGQYSGDIGFKSYYTIPTAQGSSGSAIINQKGELVGMIHSVHSRFHHIALSPTFSEMWNFLTVLPDSKRMSIPE